MGWIMIRTAVDSVWDSSPLMRRRRFARRSGGSIRRVHRPGFLLVSTGVR